MKGVVFNLLEQVVTEAHGENVWDDLLDSAEVQGAYTSVGLYPDTELSAIVVAAAEMLGLETGDVLRWFGRAAMPIFAESYPQLFSPHCGTRPFLLTLNDAIHPEVHKLHPGAQTPTFTFDATDPRRFLMGYSSPRRLCGLAEGLLLGAADHFGETAEIDQSLCMHRGDDRCLLEVRGV